MPNYKVQMNVRVSKELKEFAVDEAKSLFHSLSQYIEKLLFKEQEINEIEARRKSNASIRINE